MASKHVLNCPQCEQSIEIETTQAGQEIACSECKTAIMLGSLREIAALPATKNASLPATIRPSRSKNVLFAISLLIFLGSLAIGSVYQFSNLKHRAESEKPEVTLSEKTLAKIDDYSPTQLLNKWETVDAGAIKTRSTPTYLGERTKANRTQKNALYCFGGAGIGIALVLLVLVIKI